MISRDQPRLGIRIDFTNARNSAVFIGSSARFMGEVTISGDGSVCCFAGVSGSLGVSRVRVHIDANQACAFFGKDLTCVDAQFLLEGDGRKIVCGDDCMLSWGIFVRNYDSHSIFEVESGEVINDASDLEIGAHVWIAQDVLIAKGVRIGAGSIIGARSTVVNDIPSRVTAVGTPAKPVRHGVSWSRMRFANDYAISQARNSIEGLS